MICFITYYYMTAIEKKRKNLFPSKYSVHTFSVLSMCYKMISITILEREY